MRFAIVGMSSHAMQPDASSSPPSEAPPPTSEFPILTLDGAKLTPALGYLFNKGWVEPCESLISILWKLEKANGLSGIVVARLMGPGIDPYEGTVPQRGLVDLDRLHGSLGLPKCILRAALLAPGGRRRYSQVLRYCRPCIAHGYHSVVHQIESVDRGLRAMRRQTCRGEKLSRRSWRRAEG